MSTPGKDIAPFLQGNPATSTSGAGIDRHPNRPQPMGPTNQPDGGNPKAPNRPQPMKSPDYSPESVPGGGTLPYKGPSQPTQTPFKLGGG